MDLVLSEILDYLLNGSVYILKGVFTYKYFSRRSEENNSDNNEKDLSSLLNSEYDEPISYLISDR